MAFWSHERSTYATISSLSIIIILSGSALISDTKADSPPPQSCHLREFDLCMASAVVFIQQPSGSKVNEAEIEKQCSLFAETEECLDTFTDYCMSPMQNSLVEFMSGGMLDSMKSYCTKGSEARKGYLKHGKCVNDQRKATNKCLIDFQAAVEKSTANETHWKDRQKVMCCAMDRMKACSDAVLEPKCGKESLEHGNMMVKGTFSKAANVMCRKYKHASPECTRVLPPKGTIPKGANSKNVLSKLLSTATQV